MLLSYFNERIEMSINKKAIAKSSQNLPPKVRKIVRDAAGIPGANKPKTLGRRTVKKTAEQHFLFFLLFVRNYQSTSD